MSDIYVPIDFSDLKSVIPPGEDIIYSTLCNGFTSVRLVRKTRTYNWNTHLLMTPNGIAYYMPDTTKKKAPLLPMYSTWDEIFAIMGMGKLGCGFSMINGLSFKLLREANFETKDNFKERSREFVVKFRPLLIKKKEQWLELNRNNPEIKKSKIKSMEASLAEMKSLEKKRIAKEAKKK